MDSISLSLYLSISIIEKDNTLLSFTRRREGVITRVISLSLKLIYKAYSSLGRVCECESVSVKV